MKFWNSHKFLDDVDDFVLPNIPSLRKELSNARTVEQQAATITATPMTNDGSIVWDRGRQRNLVKVMMIQ